VSQDKINKAALAPDKVDGILSVLFYRKISTRISPAIASTPLTPNQITALSGLIGLLSVFFIAFGSYPIRILGLFVLQFARVLDHVDGEVARIKNMQSRWGTHLDVILDRFVDVAFIIAASIACFNDLHDSTVLIWGSIAAGMHLFFYYLTDGWIFPQSGGDSVQQRLNAFNIKDREMAFVANEVLITVFSIAIIIRQVKLALILCAVCSFMATVLQMVRIYKISAGD